MLIAQITDVHLGFEPNNPEEYNRQRLDRTLEALAAVRPRPDLLLLTGDLTDRGDGESYRLLREAMRDCPFPVWPCVGNHDMRLAFIDHYPEVPTADGFVQYEIETETLRVLVLDTLEEGRHGGAFCTTRERWLRARLAEQPDRPTLLVLHHPPVDAGIEWMATHAREPWVDRLAAAMAGHAGVIGLVCGHLHRAISIGWQGTAVSVCPSTAPAVALDLAPIDPDAPDGRPMIVAEPPGYALHWWNGRELVSHFDTAEDPIVLARFDVRMQPLVRSLMAERPGE